MSANTKLMRILWTVFLDSSMLATTSSRSFCRRQTVNKRSPPGLRPQEASPTHPDQHDVGGLDGHVGAGADGDADVGLSEGGRVVDPVPDHGHPEPPPLQLLHFGHLV